MHISHFSFKAITFVFSSYFFLTPIYGSDEVLDIIPASKPALSKTPSLLHSLTEEIMQKRKSLMASTGTPTFGKELEDLRAPLTRLNNTLDQIQKEAEPDSPLLLFCLVVKLQLLMTPIKSPSS